MVTTRTESRLARSVEAGNTSQFERILGNASRIALVFLGIVALFVVLKFGQVILAPVWLAVVIGLMFGPLADLFERRGIPDALSALLVVLLFIALIAIATTSFVVPLSEWIGKIPAIWVNLKGQLAQLKAPMASLSGLQNQLTQAFGGGGTAMAVRMEDGSPVVGIALIAPEVGAQVLLFLASLYFFLATRDHFRISVLSLCVTRRMRWRTAHIFNDVEGKVSRFLVVVSIINLAVGVLVALACLVLGMPTPLLWGALAFVFNYIPYIGQAVVIVVLGSAGLGTFPDLTHALLPVGCYVIITLFEGQFITPHFLGRTMTLNPFMILLTTTLSLWIWGPVGGVVSGPTLLIVQSVLHYVLPGKAIAPRRPVIRRVGMTDREEILANAARAVKEQRQDKDAREEKALAATKPVAEDAPAGAKPA